MLILTRKQSETIRIGDNVLITILRINNNDIRIGIDAPKEVSVHRSEVYDRIKSDTSLERQG